MVAWSIHSAMKEQELMRCVVYSFGMWYHAQAERRIGDIRSIILVYTLYSVSIRSASAEAASGTKNAWKAYNGRWL
jgi:hypothetical protein